MNISLNWLQDYFDEELPSVQEITKAITMKAFEVEDVVQKGNDFIFDVNVLPDRAPDSLSHRGVAKELSAILGLKFKDRSVNFNFEENGVLDVDIENSEFCSRYLGYVVENVSISESPDWMKQRLISIGQRSINNIVDATNYTMFDTGQPMHAFDFDKLEDKNGNRSIAVRKSNNDESIVTLDNEKYDIPAGTLLIVDGNNEKRILGLAGIKGGKEAEVTNNTKRIILESANFDPILTRRSSKNISLKTDASKRFENGLSKEIAKRAMLECLDIIKDVSKESIFLGGKDIYPNKEDSVKLSFSVLDVNKILGVDISSQDILDILEKKEFNIIENKGNNFTILVPQERLDLRIKEDVIDDIGKLYGYENIESKDIEKREIKIINKKLFYLYKLKTFMADAGFSEVYNYSFVDIGKISIENPLTKDKKCLRNNLSYTLNKNLDFNLKNKDLLGLDSIKIFEIGKIFKDDGLEVNSIAFGVKGLKQKFVKEELEGLLKRMSDEVFGFEIENFVKKSDFVYEFEIDNIFEKLPSLSEKDRIDNIKSSNVIYKKISQFPFVLRDIAVFVPEDVSGDEVLGIIKKEAGDLLVKTKLFDVFKKKSDDGISKVSYAFRLVFQSKEKTLTDSEINEIMEIITNSLNNNLNWQVR